MTFNWLPLSCRKTLPTPLVLFRDIDHAAGLFYARTSDRAVDEWLDVDRAKTDVIVLSTHWGDVPASVIAHEHRHFQQHYLPGLPRLGPARPAASGMKWEQAIRRFYLTQPWEMDALQYSIKVHRDDYSEQQLAAVQTAK